MTFTFNLRHHTVRKATIALIFGLAAVTTLAQPTDTVRWDDRLNQWVYTLYDPSGNGLYKEIRYTPRNQVLPVVADGLRWNFKARQFEYAYRISNHRDAKLVINNVSVRTPRWDAKPLETMPLQAGLSGTEIIAISRSETAKETAFLNSTVYASAKWEGMLNIKRPERVVFSWLSRYIESEPNFTGIQPGQSQGGFAVLRPELPVVAIMNVKGDTEDLMNKGSLPSSGPLAEQVAEMLSADFAEVPILAPGIIVPTPYNSAELVRRVRSHVATWYDLDVASKPVIDRITSLLDELALALQVNDKPKSRQLATAIFMETFQHHRGMSHLNFDQDADEHASQAAKRTALPKQELGQQTNDLEKKTPPLHRVAARSLGFNMMYILIRMETGR